MCSIEQEYTRQVAQVETLISRGVTSRNELAEVVGVSVEDMDALFLSVLNGYGR